MFYDSLEYSKSQENSINKNYQEFNSKTNTLIQNKNNKRIYKNYSNNYFRKNKNSKISKNLEKKIQKIFQIPKEKQLYTPINKKDKKEEVKQKEENYNSPKFSYMKIPLYYDYSTNSNNNHKISNKKKAHTVHRNNSTKLISTFNTLI